MSSVSPLRRRILLFIIVVVVVVALPIAWSFQQNQLVRVHHRNRQLLSSWGLLKMSFVQQDRQQQQQQHDDHGGDHDEGATGTTAPTASSMIVNNNSTMAEETTAHSTTHADTNTTVDVLYKKENRNGSVSPKDVASSESPAVVQQQQRQQHSAPVPINSLVFRILTAEDDDNTIDGGAAAASSSSYILAILKSTDRVDTSYLRRCLFERYGDKKNNKNMRIQLAPSEQVKQLCGYGPGYIPPTNLNPEPQLTLVEESLVSLQQKREEKDNNDIRLLGGGGLYQLQALLEQPSVRVASFREETDNDDNESTEEEDDNAVGGAAVAAETHDHHKPYFAVAPPPPTILDTTTKQYNRSLLQPVAFSVVGRISGVRRMARTLIFCDLAPPTATTTTTESSSSTEDDNDNNKKLFIDNDEQYPWRCGQTGDDMAVQLIIGKTFCQRFGDDDVDSAVSALKQIKAGLLVLVTGVTNVQNKESLKNWVKTRTLDLAVASVQILQEDDPNAAWRPIRRRRVENVDSDGKLFDDDDDDDDDSNSNLWGVYHGSSVPSLQKRGPSSYSNEPGMSYLSVNELYGAPGVSDNDQKEDDAAADAESPTTDTSTTATASLSPYVQMVDNLETVHEFHGQVTQLLLQLTTTATAANTTNSQQGVENQEEGDDVSPSPAAVSLVGMDCEWLPNFLMKDGGRNQPQPVLVLQVCLHSLKKVYLLDLQKMLRPLLLTSEPMNDVEAAVSEALGCLLHSQRLIKVGFQLVQDVRRLAASYPHISSFQTVHSVLEASRVGKKVMYLLKQKNSRVVTSSLARLTEHVLGKTINKEQQCSDWSSRPLNEKQTEYAALDAVVTPVIVETLRYQVDANFYNTKTGGPAIGRWENDSSFREAITSWRFLFLDQNAEISRSALRKLNAKRIVGNPWIVTQTWITGREPPRLPSVPAKDGDRYHDRTGNLRIPSQMTTIHSSNENFAQLLNVMVGERMGRSKDSCLNRFLKAARSFPEGALLDFPQRSGYVEFEDAVALFVNAPGKPGGPRPRSYPNEWLDDGKTLTWFLRENDWKQGTTSLARNILSRESPLMPVVLFVRMENGQFLCCGGCQVTTKEEKQLSSADEPPRDWDLVQLNLELLEWERLNLCEDFQGLLNAAN